MKIDVITRREELDALAERWDELACEDPRDGFFRSFVWYKAWLTHIRPDAEPFVVVVRDGGRLVGLAPLCRLKYRDLGFNLTALAWAGREVVSGDFLDFLAARDVRVAVIHAILAFLWEARRRSSVFVMGELIDGGDSYRAFEELATRPGVSIRRQEERICPYIELPPKFDDYLGELGTSTRYHIRRRMRDVEKKGAVASIYSEPEEAVARLDTLVRLHLARWKKDDLPGTFSRPGFVDFLRDVLLNLRDRSSCRLYELVHEGQAAASLITFKFGESTLYYQAGWDPNSGVAALSPGVVLMAHSIRDAIQQGSRYYEFLRGDEAYKSRWTKTYRTTATLLLATSPVGRGYLQVASLKDSIKQHLLHRDAPAVTPAEQAPIVD